MMVVAAGQPLEAHVKGWRGNNLHVTMTDRGIYIRAFGGYGDPIGPIDYGSIMFARLRMDERNAKDRSRRGSARR